MKTIAISNWMAYVPFRTSAEVLERLAVDLCDGAQDRVDRLDDGRYAAAPMSTYALAEALPRLGDRVGVAWISVVPHGAGSDRIVCRRGIQTAVDLHRARIGVTPDGLEPHLFEHIFDAAGLAPKTNYVVLKNRDEYFAAFTSGRIDAMMAPQPVRSKLFANVPDTMLFESDADLPRVGLYAPLVYRRSDWTGERTGCGPLRIHSRGVRRGTASETPFIFRGHCPSGRGGARNAEVALHGGERAVPRVDGRGILPRSLAASGCTPGAPLLCGTAGGEHPCADRELSGGRGGAASRCR